MFQVMLALLFALSLSHAHAQEVRAELSKQPPDVRQIVSTWLLKDCDLPQQAVGLNIRSRLTELGQRLEPVFWEAYNLGPTVQEIEQMATSARTAYAARQKWLREHGEELLGREESQRQVNVGEEEFLARELQNYTTVYKSAALAALGITGTEQTLVRLRDIAANQQSLDASTAQEAIRSLGDRLQRR